MTGTLTVQYQELVGGQWLWSEATTYRADDEHLAIQRADIFRQAGFHAQVLAEDGSLIYSTQEAS